MRHSQEITFGSSLLYYALTTLAGSQTLGEEYCDIFPVTSSGVGVPQPPPFHRRALLVLLQCVMPYVVTKWAAGLRRAGTLSNLPPDLQAALRAQGRLPVTERRGSEDSGAGDALRFCAFVLLCLESLGFDVTLCLVCPSDSWSFPPDNPTLLDRAKVLYAAFKARILTILPHIRTFVSKYAIPLHLAIFYFAGVYYSLAKRVVGWRYVSGSLHLV